MAEAIVSKAVSMYGVSKVVGLWRGALAGRFVNQQGRMPGLDALRGIAAFLVVIYHYTLRYQELIQPHKDKLWLTFSHAAIGVEIFFAISGFVIFMTLERCASGRDFFVSRFARLYPPFVFCMLLSALAAIITEFNPRNIHAVDILLNLPMFVGLLQRDYVDGSYWTLTCEISFYALISIFFYLVQRRLVRDDRNNFDGPGRNPLVLAVLLWMVVVVIGRGMAEDMFARWSLGFNFLYGHLFVTGVAIYGYTKGKLWVPSILLAMAVLAGGFEETGHYNLMASVKVLGVAVLIWGGAHLRLSGALAALAGFLGGISYALYLLHQALGYILIYKLEAVAINSNIAILATIFLMILLAWLVRKLIEIPAQHAIAKLYTRWKCRNASISVHDPA